MPRSPNAASVGAKGLKQHPNSMAEATSSLFDASRVCLPPAIAVSMSHPVVGHEHNIDMQSKPKAALCKGAELPSKPQPSTQSPVRCWNRRAAGNAAMFTTRSHMCRGRSSGPPRGCPSPEKADRRPNQCWHRSGIHPSPNPTAKCTHDGCINIEVLREDMRNRSLGARVAKCGPNPKIHEFSIAESLSRYDHRSVDPKETWNAADAEDARRRAAAAIARISGTPAEKPRDRRPCGMTGANAFHASAHGRGVA